MNSIIKFLISNVTNIFLFLFKLIIFLILLNIIIGIFTFFWFKNNKNILQYINYIIDVLYVEEIELDDSLANKILFRFLNNLDYVKNLQVLNKDDIKSIKIKYINMLDDLIKKKDINFILEIFKIVKLNYDDRLSEINNLIDNVDLTDIDGIIDNSDRKIKFQNNFEEYWDDETNRLINLKKKN